MAKSNKLYFLKDYITNKGIEIGEYSYFYSLNGIQACKEFQNRNVLYHFPDIYNDKLVIGKFCAIADEVKILMNGANHRINSISTYPFELLDEFKTDFTIPINQSKGNTIIGHNVWIGFGATILPGVQIGNGAIIAARAVITKNVPAYAIVGGNPGKIIRFRFSQEKIDEIEKSKWWDKTESQIKYEIDKLTKVENNSK